MITEEAKLLEYFRCRYVEPSTPIPDWADLKTVESLRAKHYISINLLGDSGRITDEGIAALSDHYDQRADRRWNRWIAIAALVISLIALLLELDDRGMLGGVLEKFRTNPSSRQCEVQASSD